MTSKPTENQPTKAPLSQEEQNKLTAETAPGYRNTFLGLGSVVIALIVFVNLLLGSLDAKALQFCFVTFLLTAIIVFVTHRHIIKHRADLQTGYKIIQQGVIENISHLGSPASPNKGQPPLYKKDRTYVVTLLGQEFQAILANYEPVTIKQHVEIHYAPTSKFVFHMAPLDTQPKPDADIKS